MDKESLEQEFVQRVMDAQGIIHKVCHMYASSEEDHQDLFQEILINLWKSYPTFRGQSRLSTWMYKVGLNVAITHLRKSSKQPKYQHLSFPLASKAQVEETPELEEERRALYTAIRQLNEVERAIVMLHLEENSNEEIAAIIGITPNYVRVKMTRIRKKLKAIVNPDQHGT